MPTQSTIQIINQKGLHARASMKLAELANQFQSDILLANSNTQANAKNVLQLMMLAAGKGSELHLSCQGEDENTAHNAICQLIENYFEESN